MKIRKISHCSYCQNTNVKQMSSFHTRLLLSIYTALTFFFLTGVIDYGALIAIIPFLTPYIHKCIDCNKGMFGLPKVRLNHFWTGSSMDKFFFTLAPSMLTITLLIINFPQTGLARVGYIPTIYFLNSFIIFLYLYKSKKLNSILNYIYRILIIIVTVILSMWAYPQEYGDSVFKLIFAGY